MSAVSARYVIFTVSMHNKSLLLL